MIGVKLYPLFINDQNPKQLLDKNDTRGTVAGGGGVPPPRLVPGTISVLSHTQTRPIAAWLARKKLSRGRKKLATRWQEAE